MTEDACVISMDLVGDKTRHLQADILLANTQYLPCKPLTSETVNHLPLSQTITITWVIVTVYPV